MTCLRLRYLAALEHDDFDALPGHVYARAFLRTYAEALGLDADRFVDEFDARYPEPEEDKRPVAVIRPHRRSRFGPRTGIAILVAAAIVGVIVWSTVSPPPRLTTSAAPAAASAATFHPRVPLALVRRPAAPQHVELVIAATNGSCWLLVRRGGASGAVLFEGMLDQGQTMRFAPRVWVRLGAPWNVVAHRGGHAVTGLTARAPVNIVA